MIRLAVGSMLVMAGLAVAQCGSAGASAGGGCGSAGHGGGFSISPMMAMGGYMGHSSMYQPPTIIRQLPQSELDSEELAFAKSVGIKRMSEATIARADREGKPLVCLMGKDILKDKKAQRVATSLKDVATLAWMADDGQRIGGDGKPLPANRIVAWSNGVYNKDSKAAYVPASKLDDGSAKKIIAFARGGSAK